MLQNYKMVSHPTGSNRAIFIIIIIIISSIGIIIGIIIIMLSWSHPTGSNRAVSIGDHLDPLTLGQWGAHLCGNSRQHLKVQRVDN